MDWKSSTNPGDGDGGGQHCGAVQQPGPATAHIATSRGWRRGWGVRNQRRTFQPHRLEIVQRKIGSCRLQKKIKWRRWDSGSIAGG